MQQIRFPLTWQQSNCSWIWDNASRMESCVETPLDRPAGRLQSINGSTPFDQPKPKIRRRTLKRQRRLGGAKQSQVSHFAPQRQHLAVRGCEGQNKMLFAAGIWSLGLRSYSGLNIMLPTSVKVTDTEGVRKYLQAPRPCGCSDDRISDIRQMHQQQFPLRFCTGRNNFDCRF